MAVPGYVKELQNDLKGITDAVAETRGAIIKIETTLTDTLPDIKTGLTTLNGTVRKHETQLALQKQAHEECPARKSYGQKGSDSKNPDSEDETPTTIFSLAKWGIKEFGVFGFQAAVIFGLFVLLLRARGLI